MIRIPFVFMYIMSEVYAYVVCYLLLRLVVSVCPCVRVFVRSSVRVKNGNGCTFDL